MATLEEIKERRGKARSGPWHCNANDLIGGWCVGTTDIAPSRGRGGDNIADLIPDEQTATFLAHSWDDVACLVEMVDVLQTLVKQACTDPSIHGGTR